MNELASPLEQIDILMQESIDKDDPYLVLVQIKRMLDVRELVGKTLAKSLYVLHQNWYNFTISQTEKFDPVIEASLGIHPYTVRRYVKWWHYQKELPEGLEDRPLREQIPITNALSQGYDFDEEDWEKLERTTSLTEVQKVIREDVKNKEPRASSLQIYMDDDGNLWCWRNQIRSEVGMFFVNEQDEGTQLSIERLIKNGGVILK